MIAVADSKSLISGTFLLLTLYLWQTQGPTTQYAGFWIGRSLSFGRGIIVVLCPWTRHFTLTVCAFLQPVTATETGAETKTMTVAVTETMAMTVTITATVKIRLTVDNDSPEIVTITVTLTVIATGSMIVTATKE